MRAIFLVILAGVGGCVYTPPERQRVILPANEREIEIKRNDRRPPLRIKIREQEREILIEKLPPRSPLLEPPVRDGGR